MATYLRTRVVKNIGTTPADVIQTVANNRFTVIGCNLANVIDDPVTVDIYVVDASSTIAYYVRGIVIPENTSVKVITNGEKLILAEQCGLRIVSNTEDSIDAVVSYAEVV
jgi:DeoR/GlpR family transcriptional regulator of sugar metabolism